jgi:hypothetical protein
MTDSENEQRQGATSESESPSGPPAIRSVADLNARALDRAIVEAASQGKTDRLLLMRSGVPDSQIPVDQKGDVVWDDVFRRIQLGVSPYNSQAEGFAALLEQFASTFPANPAFQPWHPDRSRNPAPQGAGIVLRDYRGEADEVFRRAEHVARDLGIPAPVELALPNDVQITLCELHVEERDGGALDAAPLVLPGYEDTRVVAVVRSASPEGVTAVHLFYSVGVETEGGAFIFSGPSPWRAPCPMSARRNWRSRAAGSTSPVMSPLRNARRRWRIGTSVASTG